MSETTPLLDLPYLQPAQAQKHVTHNEALRLLDACVQLSVPGFGETQPPADPQPGQRLLVGEGAMDAWTGQDHAIAIFVDDAWQFVLPAAGWTAWMQTMSTWAIFDGSQWTPMAPSVWGINASADTQTRLAVASEGTLLNHDGTDHRLRINKARLDDTASLLFQTGFSGRAEMGLAGNDGFAVKLSADGQTWRTALTFDPASGIASGDAVQQSATDATSGRLMRAEYGVLRSDIVGVVGQSNGQPTGALMERNASGQGHVIKCADGTMMMSRQVTIDTNSTAAQTFDYPETPATVLSGSAVGADASEAADIVKRQALAEVAVWTDSSGWVVLLPQALGAGELSMNLSATGLWY